MRTGSLNYLGEQLLSLTLHLLLFHSRPPSIGGRGGYSDVEAKLCQTACHLRRLVQDFKRPQKCL